MGIYHVAQICRNGHMITDSVDKYREHSQPFCSKCGSATITACPSCNVSIRGDYDCGIVVIGRNTAVPSYCHNCGSPYPWTQSALENTAAIIQEEEDITEQLKAVVVESLPDIIVETPGTNLAAVRVKKCLSAAGKFTSDAIRQFVIDFGCELAKKSIGL